ncbi:hypothetical protein F0562_035528 [Nyssa sinensis]|uniref:SUN domain-containing protein n=1 Tax=Nyssa sinensis TaxID=561372 RepID=A0A5J5AGE1_9ASTE|nr:hypothetical protein F0562_035528 [Nyssa sinensis]
MKQPCNDNSINIKCRSNSVNNNRKRFCGLSFRFIFSLWCLLFLFYSKLGNGGNLDADNKGIPNPSLCPEKSCNCEYSYLADGSENHTNGMLLEFNISMNGSNSTVQDYESANSTCSLAEAKGLEVIVWNILGFSDLVCELQPKEEQKKEKLGKLPNEKTHPAYLNLDEFRIISRQQKDGGIPSRLVNITHRLEPDGTEYNYASASKGAKVLAHNKEAKGPSNILGKDNDKYLRNPCSVGEKFVVIELAEETLVDAVKIANFEHYSSNFKEFRLSGSLIYPTETWYPLGNFVAANVKHAQSFKLPEPKWVRYLKLNLLSHYGSEFYCTLSVLEVYGIDAIERMLEDLIVASAESATNKLPNPNSTEMSSLKPGPGPSDQKRDGEMQDVIEAADKGIETIDNGQRLNIDVIKNPVTINTIPDPVMEIRQLPNGRIPGDSVLKILMQKVRSLELNLSVLEEYIKELNRRQGDVLPELDKELSKISLLLQKSKTEIKDLLEWKEIMDKGIADLESWKAVIASRLDALVRENGMLRLDVEKVASDQVSLEKKELAVLVVSFFFACIAILKLVSERAMMFFGSPMSEKVFQTSRVTALCCLFALFAIQSSPLRKSKSVESDRGGGNSLKNTCNCTCSCNAGSGAENFGLTKTAPYLNGGSTSGGGEMLERAPVVAAERHTGASMMEQLVPEITTHALSYLDYPSLCRLSMTNSLMRKAANDDNAWKALYHKDFTLEQDSVTPVSGWKAYYAATRAIVDITTKFFNIIRERSLLAMGHLWLNADYVKCVHASGEIFTGYNAVMEGWQLAFNWEQGVDFQIRDVRVRVLTDMAWVTMRTYVDVDTGPFNVTNIYEFHNGRWYIVHHHSSVMLIDREGDHQIVQGLLGE